jgi:DUF1365 family protein
VAAAAGLGINLRCAFVIFRYYASGMASNLRECGLYIGRVKHSRLKGGNTHHFSYPIFFSLLDLDEIKCIGWSMWPIFKVNGGRYSFCSLDYKDHLRDAVGAKSSPESNNHLADRARAFIHEKSGCESNSSGRIKLLAHLTYFGYCFNPISIFYQLASDRKAGDGDVVGLKGLKTEDSDNNTRTEIATIIAEVSNTPWIEQHSYVLHESVKDVEVTRDCDGSGSFLASWNKEFHVSPFMEMDYRYTFMFSEPKDTLWVKTKMTKTSTNEVWFTASFEIEKIPFTPLNVLYVLVAYPVRETRDTY